MDHGVIILQALYLLLKGTIGRGILSAIVKYQLLPV